MCACVCVGVGGGVFWGGEGERGRGDSSVATPFSVQPIPILPLTIAIVALV